MNLATFHTSPVRADTEAPVPAWATRAAYLLPLLLLPACLWRLPFAFGFEMGTAQETDAPLWLSIPYVVGLSALTEASTLLTIGLVRGWGERIPARIPVIGGRPVRPMAVVVPGAVCGGLLTLVSVQMVLGWFGVVDRVGYESSGWRALATVCITPMGLWGPIVLALTGAYYVRRCRPARPGVVKVPA